MKFIELNYSDVQKMQFRNKSVLNLKKNLDSYNQNRTKNELLDNCPFNSITSRKSKNPTSVNNFFSKNKDRH